MSQNARRLPTNAESMKLLLIKIMEESLSSMEKLRDREWLLRLIAQLRNPNKIGGEVRHIKPTGVVRKLDPLGRTVLPVELRRTMGIKTKDDLEIYTEGEWIVLQKVSKESRCAACGSEEDLNPFKSIYLCESCIGELFEINE